MMVLLGEVLMLNTGNSLKGMPPNNLLGVSSSGKMSSFLLNSVMNNETTC